MPEDRMSEIHAGELLVALSVGGLLGLAGQGVRAVAGLKKMSDDAQNKGVAPRDMFSPSWFFVSLAVGFIAGVIASLTLGISNLVSFDSNNTQLPLGIMAAGYTGTDFVEAFASRISTGLLPKIPAPPASGASDAASFPA
jgi:hypothetical protein